jgi:hypothetical protein
VSRHRSPGGRRARRDLGPVPAGVAVARRPEPPIPQAPACPGRPGVPAAAARRDPARRHAATAAAVTGGTLALTLPLVPLLHAAAPTAGTATVRLSAEGAPLGTAHAGTPADRSRTLVPVGAAAGADRSTLDAAGLIKAAGLTDAADRAERARQRVDCGVDLSGLGRVKPWVSAAARFLSCLYDRPGLIGVAGRGRVSDHPLGYALDLMARGAEGDRIAACAVRNREALGISYVIWKQRIDYGSGWEPMADRGSATENHVDHVHISFEHRAPGGAPDPRLCG